jgi:hypothetical protein
MTKREPTVLREITGVSEDASGHVRRWFHDDYFDLFVKQDREGEIVALELCYGAGHKERALVWKKDYGHFYDGAGPEDFDPDELAKRFTRECGEVPHGITTSVLRTIRDFSQIAAPPRSRRQKFRRENWQER